MKAEPVTHFIFTDHAKMEMARRGLSEAVVRDVLSAPDQRWNLRQGRDVVQSEVSMGEPAKPYVVRVFVDVDRTPCEVVTAYRRAESRSTGGWSHEGVL